MILYTGDNTKRGQVGALKRRLAKWWLLKQHPLAVHGLNGGPGS